jgi:hypothetical protein
LILRSCFVSTCRSTVRSLGEVSCLLIFVLSPGCAKHTPGMLTRNTDDMNRIIRGSILLAIRFSLQKLDADVASKSFRLPPPTATDRERGLPRDAAGDHPLG